MREMNEALIKEASCRKTLPRRWDADDADGGQGGVVEGMEESVGHRINFVVLRASTMLPGQRPLNLSPVSPPSDSNTSTGECVPRSL